MRVTSQLRFIEREVPSIDPGYYGVNRPKYRILQQAWQDIGDGCMEWRDVPLETESTDETTQGETR